jgi:hypothetical protein
MRSIPIRPLFSFIIHIIMQMQIKKKFFLFALADGRGVRETGLAFHATKSRANATPSRTPKTPVFGLPKSRPSPLQKTPFFALSEAKSVQFRPNCARKCTFLTPFLRT